jgi:hypothetical protein
MLATVILDTFRQEEAPEIAAALDCICSPDDNYGFASSAIYCFWSIKPRDILYIGLATNVAERFCQHTGLLPCEANCCKRVQISDYFQKNDRLGYSLIVQSTMEQPRRKRKSAAAKVRDDDAFKAKVRDIMEGEANIAFAEGLLIHLYQQLADRLPPWNKIQGAKAGHGAKSISPWNLRSRFRAMEHLLRYGDIDDIEESPDTQNSPTKELFVEEVPPFHFLENLDGSHLSAFNAKCTLREMAADATFCANEEFLHAARVNMLNFTPDLDLALAHLSTSGWPSPERIELMRQTGYLTRQLPLVL